jgi:hypothetical protein
MEIKRDSRLFTRTYQTLVTKGIGIHTSFDIILYTFFYRKKKLSVSHITLQTPCILHETIFTLFERGCVHRSEGLVYIESKNESTVISASNDEKNSVSTRKEPLSFILSRSVLRYIHRFFKASSPQL